VYSRANESTISQFPRSLNTLTSVALEDPDISPPQGRFRDQMIMNKVIFALVSSLSHLRRNSKNTFICDYRCKDVS